MRKYEFFPDKGELFVTESVNEGDSRYVIWHRFVEDLPRFSYDLTIVCNLVSSVQSPEDKQRLDDVRLYLVELY
jgi:hypothetical protein